PPTGSAWFGNHTVGSDTSVNTADYERMSAVTLASGSPCRRGGFEPGARHALARDGYLGHPQKCPAPPPRPTESEGGHLGCLCQRRGKSGECRHARHRTHLHLRRVHPLASIPRRAPEAG